MINDDDANVTNVGYFLKTDVSRGVIENASAFGASLTVEDVVKNVLTIVQNAEASGDTDHDLITGDYVTLSELVGNVVANQVYIDEFVNGKRFDITKTSASQFTVVVISNSTASGALASDTVAGQWTEDTKKIYFSKDVSGTVKVYYYALPEVKNSITSRVDLPDQLLTAAIHHTLGDLLNLSGKLQLGSGHKGLAYSTEREYIKTSRAKDPMQDIMALPLQDFI